MKKFVLFFIILSISSFLYAGIVGDINEDGIIDFQDVDILASQWLGLPGSPSADIAPFPSGDGKVDLLDFRALAAGWLLTVSDSLLSGDINEDGIIDFQDVDILASQWLGLPGSPSADIAPFPSGDGKVDLLDFHALAAGWLLTVADSNEMVFIPGGEFQMGDPNNLNDSDPDSDERPGSSCPVRFFFI